MATASWSQDQQRTSWQECIQSKKDPQSQRTYTASEKPTTTGIRTTQQIQIASRQMFVPQSRIVTAKCQKYAAELGEVEVASQVFEKENRSGNMCSVMVG